VLPSIFTANVGDLRDSPIGLSDGTVPKLPLQRGRAWSICAAMTINGWLPCTGVKEGYFKTPDLLNWLHSMLLPALCRESDRPCVVVMDNNSTHVDEVIVSAIEAGGHIVRFLPPYSPDFNPIELTFSVLKAWLQRNYIGHARPLRDSGTTWYGQLGIVVATDSPRSSSDTLLEESTWRKERLNALGHGCGTGRRGLRKMQRWGSTKKRRS
jgi:transposase